MDKAYDQIKAALEQFHLYNKQFKKLDPAYADHVERLKKLQQVLAESEKYLTKAEPGDPRLSTVQSLLKDARDTYVKASPNAKRAKTARRELRAIKKKDKNSPERITDEIINMMVMGVAAPMSETDEKGASGILGISAAVNAAEALVMMQQKEYDKMIQLLAESGDDPGVVAKKATLREALGEVLGWNVTKRMEIGFRLIPE
jgi:chromosome segregation ATPase